MSYLPIKESPSSSSFYLLSSFPSSAFIPIETMRRKAPTTLFLVFLCLLFTVFCSLLLSRNAISLSELRFHPQNINARPKDPDYSLNHVIAEDSINHLTHRTRHVSSIQGPSVPVDSVSVLLPDWEVLVLVSPDAAQLTSPSPAHSGESFHCLFPNKETSPANFSGVLPFSNATAFKCLLPEGNRRHKPFRQPVLTRSPEKESSVISPAPVMPRWDFLVYESLSTETDVILFAKGVNNRQGINRPPEELSCVFSNEVKNTTVKTTVTVSMQEVFRCQHPDSTVAAEKVKVSLEINTENQVVPSVAYYNPPPPRRTEATQRPKSKICATTMVYNVGKYLREWVMYYSKIGVDKFFLYDNESNDNLESIIKELKEEDDYKIERILWIWPKTQEAGFSHSAVYGKDSCTWMMYVDVDEFIYSPSWLQSNSTQPSKNLLPSLLPSASNQAIGQVSIKCNDFGPSEQREHPAEGVIQGYNCRRRVEQRHKSIVRLDAVDDSLVNVIHHFGLNKSNGYGWKYLPMEVAAVNHYKYQAWPEFMTKFRRRVSAFVADWTTAVNPNSKDRTPGLGFEAIKPERWEKMFCEVKDERLKVLTQRWFGFETPEGLKMAWQR